MRDQTRAVSLPDLEHHGLQLWGPQLNCRVARVYPRPDAVEPSRAADGERLSLAPTPFVERLLGMTVVLVSIGGPLIAAGMTLQALMLM